MPHHAHQQTGRVVVPETTVAVAPTTVPPLMLAFDKPDVRLGMGALTWRGATGKPILTGQCFMLQQASFYGAQWPKGTDVSENGDAFAFYLPPIGTNVPTPVVGGGEFVTAFGNRPEVKAVQQYLSTPAWHAATPRPGTTTACTPIRN